MKYHSNLKLTSVFDFFLKNSFKKFIFLLCIFSVSSCRNSQRSNVSQKILSINADTIAHKNGFKKELIDGGDFIFTTYSKITNPLSDYVFYIEGDGNITKFGGTPSKNPTPRNPMVLKLAIKDMRENVVYVARPCQYTPMSMNPKCTEEYWTNKRWSEDSVDNINNVINSLASKAKNIHLVGFSGGGGIAVLVAVKNKKVKDIITVAGNLNVSEFIRYHKNIPCLGSMNPIDYAKKIKNIPQIHLSGSEDKRVPFFIADSFIKKSNSSCVKHRIIDGNTHSKGWLENWENILKSPINCN